VSPTGGGVLNSFGRGFAESKMSKWSFEEEGGFAHGKVELPESVMVGGDVRAVGFHRDNGAFSQQRFWLMQADGELAWKPTEQITVAGSLGLYEHEVESQRHYVMYAPTETLSMRVGRFFPAFGIHTPDHAIATKRWLGWNEGKETNNVEVAWLGDAGEVIVTAAFAAGEEDDGVSPSGDPGLAARGAWYVGDTMQVGLSYFGGQSALFDRQVAGVFLSAGFAERYFLMTEMDFQTETRTDSDKSLPATRGTRLRYSRLGWEADQGLLLSLTEEELASDRDSPERDYTAFGAGVQWFPRPHWELWASWQKRWEDAFDSRFGDMATVMAHYYF
jgi:hypothetical protein